MRRDSGIEDLSISPHAKKRSSQRAIKIEILPYVLQHGTCFYAGDGASAFWLNRKTMKSLPKGLRRKIKSDKIAAIVSSDGNLVTLMHCPKIPHHWRQA